MSAAGRKWPVAFVARAPLHGKILITPQQQSKKFAVLQQGVTHLDGLLAW